MARPKKDEHNYHLKRQEGRSFIEKMIDAMPGNPKTPTRPVLRPPATIINSAEMWEEQRMADLIAQQRRQQLAMNPQYRGMAIIGASTNIPFSKGLNTTMALSTRSSSRPVWPSPRFQPGDIVTWGNRQENFQVIRVNSDNYRLRSTVRQGYEINYGFGDTDDFVLVEETSTSAASPKVKVDFDTVIIEDEKRQQILEALEQINQSDLIFNVWGFGETIEKGKGVAILFHGQPGTGKTLMAQAIANKLGCKLKVISTADVESSAPGEAERNIRKHFEEAKGGKTVLLFDECDSLIYTRQNVGAIMAAQINELLSQIERFDGVTLFTTNRLGTLDEAMNRRLALKLEFSMPTPAQRVEIWQRMFPKRAPLDKDIDWLTLAEIEITGGYIKNVVLRAARMAAIEKVPDKKKRISMRHLVRALRYEAQSMIEFDEARAKHRKGIGHVDMRRGQATITKG